MKDIPGYDGLYAVTKDGRVWSYPKPMGNRMQIRGKFLKPWLVGGYEVVSMWKERIHRTFLVHRLVAMTYHANPHGFRTVNHKNGNKRDNRPVNLEWCTHKENIHHAMRNNLFNSKGENHGMSKLRDEDVMQIKQLLKQEGAVKNEIARRYNVSPSVIGFISAGKTWKHIK